MPRVRWPSLPRSANRSRRPRRRRRAVSGGAFLLLLALWWFFGRNEAESWPRAQVLDAIRFVESGDRAVVPDGDDGKAIGPYQIHEVYWRDAVAFEPGLGGDYQRCRERAYAERVIDAYMRKWVAGPWARGEAEVIARVHNGGPKGQENRKTDGYWAKVRARLP